MRKDLDEENKIILWVIAFLIGFLLTGCAGYYGGYGNYDYSYYDHGYQYYGYPYYYHYGHERDEHQGGGHEQDEYHGGREDGEYGMTRFLILHYAESV